MRLFAQQDENMIFAGYRLNADALLARIVYRWHWMVALGLLAAVALVGLMTGAIPPVWRGSAALVVTAAPGATITVDGRAWPSPLYAGEHRVIAELPDGRATWADFVIASGETISITLPAGLPEPRERALPPAAPGMRIAQVWWADGSWRVQSQPVEERPRGATPSSEPIVTPGPGQTVAVGAQGAERLATIDAYAGLADQVHVGDQLLEAVYVPVGQSSYGDRTLGMVEVRGWAEQTTPITVTSPLSLVRFSPTGDAILVAEQTTIDGEQVSIVGRDGTRASVVAVPGHITRLSWRDDGRGVVLHSRQGDRLALTLVRLEPSIAAAVIADLAGDNHAGDIVPLTWDTAGLLWIAPDETGTSVLWRAPLASLIPERMADVDGLALTYLDSGNLRVLRVMGDALVIGRYQGAQFIGEAVVERIAPSDDLMGIWHGDELLLQGAGRAWLLTLSGELEAAHPASIR
jgi:hypothetical protein